MEYTIPKGVFDVLPKEPKSEDAWRASDHWHYVESTMRKCAADYGFKEIRTPLFERTELFVRGLNFPGLNIVMVNESGASIYSASEAAREEFPDKDVTVRGAVSIGRRLVDPLAELVKIDPKSIGVGQYQHDVDQTRLQAKLASEQNQGVRKTLEGLLAREREAIAQNNIGAL